MPRPRLLSCAARRARTIVRRPPTSAVEHAYRYRHPSRVALDRDRLRLELATSSPGPDAHPHCFEGRLRSPRRAADLLLAVAQVVRARWFTPPAMLARLMLEADPVVTSEGGRLRFEGFSLCCSCYARADLLPAAVEAEHASFGSTNVDFGPGMVQALQRLDDAQPASLAVGRDEVRLRSDAGETVERRVALPLRWRKGMAEVQALQAELQPRLEIAGAEVVRLLRDHPRGAKAAWLVPHGRSARWSQTTGNGGVRVAGLQRLQSLLHVLPHARSLRVHGGIGDLPVAFELRTDDARLHLVLSAEVWRGFSGEGRLLHDLAAEPDDAAAAAVASRLRFGDLVAAAGVGERRALARLATSGQAGYDLGEARWFRRELPFDRSDLEALHPRLLDARALQRDGKVALRSRQPIAADVTGSNGVHRVGRDGGDDGDWTCTCPWFAQHGADRGPCKHVLATRLAFGSGGTA